MVPFKTLCILVLMGLILATWAQEIDEAALAAGEFEEVDIYFDSAEDETVTRGIFGKKKDRCSCTDKNSCGCCAKPRILGYKLRGCLNFTIYSTEKKLQFALAVQEQQVAQFNFSIAPVDKICSNLPGKLKVIKFCLFTNTTETEEHGLTSCSSLDLIYKETTIGIINFSCIRLKDGVLDFDMHQEIDRTTVLKVKIKNPISVIKNLINKLLSKREEAN
uniref:Venom protein family 2 protein 3 n=1 Tax=Platymeris rhadamanthus TaxID=1134088 RepID=A0A6B9L677_PLARH|nr:venom protein family 2 protein 3 [Platymeris rhadamanthus]